jgi:amino acid transporter
MKKGNKWFLGAPKDPLAAGTAQKLALTVFFAWIGLGADGISSACYGPEQAFLALGQHTILAFWLVILTIVTVSLIAYAYNRIIHLFPNGGGGYKVATSLLGEYAGLAAGIGLIIDYVLTIVISVASGMDQLFSLLPHHSNIELQVCSAILIMLLTYLNMRGMKESVRVLVPIFIGFLIIHVCLICYGLVTHANQLTATSQLAVTQTHLVWHQFGFVFILAVFLHAYAQGGGTYTGLEAVSNNVTILQKPRVKTGQKTMVYMAISLSFMAGGILLLYLLWHVSPQHGKTLNAVLFGKILGNTLAGRVGLFLTLIFEAGLLFIAANTGFLGGPSVLSNLAMDQWVPKSFVNISSRLVRQNGILLFGIFALMLLFITDGRVKILVVIYSISVFLAFTIALFGLFKYYWNSSEARSVRHYVNLILVGLGALFCAIVLVVMTITSFDHGGWLALVMIGLLLWFCIYIRKDYKRTNAMLAKLDDDLNIPLKKEFYEPIMPDTKDPTAIILVGRSRGAAMHTFLTIKRLFGAHYKNFIFFSIAIVDAKTVVGHDKIEALKQKHQENLDYLTNFCYSRKIPAMSVLQLSVDPAEELNVVATKLAKLYPKNAFFASQLIFSGNQWMQKMNHNKTALAMQRRIYSLGLNMMILPVKVDIRKRKPKQKLAPA